MQRPFEVRAYLRPLANAGRDIERGMGVEDNFSRILDDLAAQRKSLRYNVLVLTEFHRGLTRMHYERLKAFLAVTGGRIAGGLQRNVLEGDQRGRQDEPSAINPKSMQLLVCTWLPSDRYMLKTRFTSFDPPNGQRDYPLVNGHVVLDVFSDAASVIPVASVACAHTTFSCGRGQMPEYGLACKELFQVTDENTQGLARGVPLLGIGDFNLTDASAAAIAEDHPQLLAHFRPALGQADFVCSPHDRLPADALLSTEERVAGHTNCVFGEEGEVEEGEEKAGGGESACPGEERRVRVCSALGKVFGVWDEVRYFDPVLHENISGMSAEELIAFYRSRGVDLSQEPSLYDHAACLAVKRL
jgi:hypothetical protein